MHYYGNQNLAEFCQLSLDKQPHLWTLQDDQLINEKNNIQILKTMINCKMPNNHSIQHIFMDYDCSSGYFNDCTKIYKKYLKRFKKQQAKNFYPLDQFYQIAENMQDHPEQWIGDKHHLENKQLNISIDFRFGLFKSKSRINQLPITNMQAIHLLITLQLI